MPAEEVLLAMKWQKRILRRLVIALSDEQAEQWDWSVFISALYPAISVELKAKPEGKPQCHSRFMLDLAGLEAARHWQALVQFHVESAITQLVHLLNKP